MSDDAMWAIVMFDLPVKTAMQRREATKYRNDLLDLGFQMVQYSVYSRYSVTAASALRLATTLTTDLPEGGEVRILRLTDKQWSNAIRFSNGKPTQPEPEPDDYMLF